MTLRSSLFLKHLSERLIIVPRYLVLEELEELNVVNNLSWLFDRAGLIIFSIIREDAYEEITREFINSFEHSAVSRTVSFRLMEQNYDFSIVQFGTFFGF